MLIAFHIELPPTPALQVVETVANSDRDRFPGNRCAPRPDGAGQQCTQLQPGNPYQVLLTWLNG